MVFFRLDAKARGCRWEKNADAQRLFNLNKSSEYRKANA